MFLNSPHSIPHILSSALDHQHHGNAPNRTKPPAAAKSNKHPPPSSSIDSAPPLLAVVGQTFCTSRVLFVCATTPAARLQGSAVHLTACHPIPYSIARPSIAAERHPASRHPRFDPPARRSQHPTIRPAVWPPLSYRLPRTDPQPISSYARRGLGPPLPNTLSSSSDAQTSGSKGAWTRICPVLASADYLRRILAQRRITHALSLTALSPCLTHLTPPPSPPTAPFK